MSREWRALRYGESALARRREIERAYELFLAHEPSGGGEDSAGVRHSHPSVREVVLDSWQRSIDRAIDPDAKLNFHSPGAASLSDDELRELRRIHPLASALPVLERLLLDEAADSGFIVAVGDAQGRLLWVDGDHELRSKAEGIGFAPGMDWSERAVGTSAPGSALALGHPIQVFGAEHFNRAVHQWSCAATPVHDPETGAILGVIDITGGETIAEPHVLPLVEATRLAVEAELQLAALRRRVERERRSPPNGRGASGSGASRQSAGQRGGMGALKLVVLGREQALLNTQQGVFEIGRRHAEILLALALSPQGLSAAVLAQQVYGERESQETLRAEIVRLRKFFKAHGVQLTLESRPYRLGETLHVDAAEALAALGRGAHRLALASYGGAVLPGSDAPAVVSLRAELDATLREAMLQSAAPELLFDYAQQWADDDAYVWETLLQILPQLSPKRARVVARLEQLQR